MRRGNARERRRNDKAHRDFEQQQAQARSNHHQPHYKEADDYVSPTPPTSQPIREEGVGFAKRPRSQPPRPAPKGNPDGTATFNLRTEPDGTPMINVGMTASELDEMILLIDDEEGSSEPDEKVLAKVRKKLVNRKRRLTEILQESGRA